MRRVMAGAVVVMMLALGVLIAGTGKPAALAAYNMRYQAQSTQTVEPMGLVEPTEMAGNGGDNIQQGDHNGTDTEGSEEIKGAPENNANEVAEAQTLASQASITQQQAEHVALVANPGTTVVHSSLGDENGNVVYDIELSNGSDVKVSAQTGAIIATDQATGDGAGGESEEDNQIP